ncbi:MAG: cobyrinic acid a,c-diamide synthase, partial [Actinomycetota bacterium]|nr:cobyrinic acid a,c-diamide synthase [Actinomycetota bacterium]
GERRVRVAVAAGAAFGFVYPDNLERLEEAGAEVVPFDPMSEDRLPAACAGLYAGGGFPEVFAPALAANRPLLDDVGAQLRQGLVVWAECGGMLWLCRQLDGHALAGALPATASMTTRLTLGYRTATARTPTPLAAAGETLRGHEFHYSTVEPAGDALRLAGRFAAGAGGFGSPTMLASYLHLHLGADPRPAERFVATAAAAAGRRRFSDG